MISSEEWSKILAYTWRDDAREVLEQLRANENCGVADNKSTRISINVMMAKRNLPFRLRPKGRVAGEKWTWRDSDINRLYRLQEPG